MSYCGLWQSQDTAHGIDIVEPTDPIGDGFSFDVTVVHKDIANAVIEYVLKSRVGACHVLCSSVALVDAITAGLSDNLSVLSVTGDSPYQEQIACAKRWFRGEHDVLVSTVVALVGNENRECKTIVVAGFLFNVSSLVQAIGRLRPEQRGNTSKVHVFRPAIGIPHRRDAKVEGEQVFSEIVQAECLTMESRELFMALFSPVGLQEVLSLKDGCYLQHLSRMYGFLRHPCARCGLCLQEEISPDHVQSGDTRKVICPDGVSSDRSVQRSPTKRSCTLTDNVLIGKEVVETKNNFTKELFRKAKWVFTELRYRCLACGKSFCNGECVNACFRCGSIQHGYTSCKYTPVHLATLLPNKGVCFGCFDTRQHLMTDHDIKSCPLQRRLKRLVFLHHAKSAKNFEEYLRHLYSSEVSFASMVASFADKASLGR
jgi:hypothetical protein